MELKPLDLQGSVVNPNAKFCGKCGQDLSIKKFNETSSFENLINARSVTERKVLTYKLLSDVKKEAKKAKNLQTRNLDILV